MEKTYVEYILPKRNMIVIYFGKTTLGMPTRGTVQRERNGPQMILV